MADITISNLNSIAVATGLLLPVSDGTTTGKVTIGNINSLAPVQSVAGRTGAVTLTKTDVGLSNVENKSSATIRSEITSSNVTTALGYTPYNNTNPSNYITANNASVAKAWVSFNGYGTVGQNQTIYRSYNVTNVVRDSTYNYTIYFTTPMPGTNYAFAGTSVSAGVVPTVRETATPQTINSCLTDRLLITTGTGGTSYTGSYISIIVFA